MDEQNVDILEQIHASYFQLTATEKRVADFVLNNSERVQFMSITQLSLHNLLRHGLSAGVSSEDSR